LLLHDAGYPPDPIPGYSEIDFPCPENKLYHPKEVFDCQRNIYNSLMEQKLINPVGGVYVYSDLSMITAMYVVGHLAQKLQKVSRNELRSACIENLDPNSPEIAQCYYEAFVKKYILIPKSMTQSSFLPDKSEWNDIAPTWDDDVFRHRVIQGQVSDENSYSLGGIAGHAGLFSSARDAITLASSLMWAPVSSSFVNKTTALYFTTIYNVTQSSRALGWDTNNYQQNTYRGCGNLSPTTWTHTGYTGTQICGDPVRKIVTVLLTNRCYPNKSKTLPDIHRARKEFNNAVKAAFDANEN